MNIVVCIKQVPGSSNITTAPKTNTLVREGVKSIVNPFDTYALEEGVRLKERYGGKVTVITMGPPQAEEALRQALAMGPVFGLLSGSVAGLIQDALSSDIIGIGEGLLLVTLQTHKNLIAAANRFLAKPLSEADVVSSFAGIRPLYDDGKFDVAHLFFARFQSALAQVPTTRPPASQTRSPSATSSSASRLRTAGPALAASGLRVVLTDDQTVPTRAAIGVMQSNALFGLAMVLGIDLLVRGSGDPAARLDVGDRPGAPGARARR